jgi:hypothetical protein
VEVAYTYEAKPVTLNKWRTLHYMQCSKIRREWREAFHYLYLANPQAFRGEQVEIIVEHEVKGRWQDPVSCAECFKAALDGLVDGGMIVDDSPEYVRSVTFMMPVKTGRDALTLRVRSC